MIGSRLGCEDGQDREFTKEMATKMLPGLDYIQSLSADPSSVEHTEERVDLTRWVGPGESGTADHFNISLTRKKLTTFDWKWGAGVPVQPDWNDQGMLYTLGVWDTFAKEIFEDEGIDASEIEVDIVIEQPRAPGGGGVWTTQLTTLLREGRAIRKDADATLDPDAPYNPGADQCKFCPAARLNTCQARSKWLSRMIGAEDLLDEAEARVEAEDVIELIERRSLTPEQRSYILLNQKAITSWLTQLHEEAIDDAVKGRPVPGMKRVKGRAGRRKWRDEAKAKVIVSGRLGDDVAYRKQLLSPAQVEDEVGKEVYRERYGRHVMQADPSPALVPESDPKPALPSARDLLTAEDLGEPESLI